MSHQYNHEHARDAAIDFIQRWRERVPVPRTDGPEAYSEQSIDSFVSQFIAFNRLYNALWAQERGFPPEPKTEGRSYDSELHRASTCIAAQLDCDAVIKRIGALSGAPLALVARDLGEHGQFYLLEEDEDPHFADGHENEPSQERVAHLLNAIYRLRCNLFHGDKGLFHAQKKLLACAAACLSVVIEDGLRVLRAWTPGDSNE